MELYFLDKGLQRLTAPLDFAVSLQWQLRYFECGTFRAVLSADAGLITLLKKAEYLSAVMDGEIRCGRIDSVEISDGKMVIAGRSLECILFDRVISDAFQRKGRVSWAVVQAVSENCGELPLVIGEDSAEIDVSGFFASAWENLGTWVYRVLRPYGASCRVELDSERESFVFRVVNPGSASRTVLSASFGNLLDTVYGRDTSSLKNKVYVEGKDGKLIWMDVSNGAVKKEVYRKAEDLCAELFETVSEYTDALLIRAKEVLAGYEAGAVMNVLLSEEEASRFGRAYQVGDYCYAADEETGIYAKARIIGADENWHHGQRTIRLSLML